MAKPAQKASMALIAQIVEADALFFAVKMDYGGNIMGVFALVPPAAHSFGKVIADLCLSLQNASIDVLMDTITKDCIWTCRQATATVTAGFGRTFCRVGIVACNKPGSHTATKRSAAYILHTLRYVPDKSDMGCVKDVSWLLGLQLLVEASSKSTSSSCVSPTTVPMINMQH